MLVSESWALTRLNAEIDWLTSGSGWQAPPEHAPPWQLWPQAPQLRGSEAVTAHAPEQSVAPAVQVNPHDRPLQVAAAFAWGAHAVHDVGPQLLMLKLDTQAVPHRWKPGLQANPHVVPLQVAVALAGGTHGVHDVPQVAVLASDEQIPLQL